ncbi:MAG: hypothetical protein AB1805_10055 [Nitrospirota bacterium]
MGIVHRHRQRALAFCLLGLLLLIPAVASAAWDLTTVDSAVDADYTSVAVDKNNKIHISYYDTASGNLKYATNAAGFWASMTLDSVGDVGRYTSIAVDSTNKVHISYMDYGGGNLKYVTNASGTWVASVIDTYGDTGWGTSIAIDRNNKVHIGYFEIWFGSLRYATNASGAWATADVVRGNMLERESTSIAVDGNIKAYIVLDGSNSYYTNAPGTWTSIPFAGGAFDYYYPSIRVDSANKVHISYAELDSSMNNSYLKYATNASGSWATAIIESAPYPGVYYSTSLSLDIHNKAHITYDKYIHDDYLQGGVRYAANATGAWVISAVEGAFDSLRYPSIAVDKNGAAHISLSGAGLQYATNAATADLIIDNRDTATTSRTGAWHVSSGPDPYAADSLWSNGGFTFSWHFTPPTTGSREVAMWWTAMPSRGSRIPVDIQHAGGTARVYVNQQANGGKWNTLGTFTFQAGIRYKVTIVAQAYPTTTCADAVKVSSVTPDLIIDNRDTASTSRTGTWYISGAPDPYGPDSLYSRDGSTFSWYFRPTENGERGVSMWWTQWPSRSTTIPVDIEHAFGTARVTINQLINGGTWNFLGNYPFEAGGVYKVTIYAQPGPSSTCADAVKFGPPEAILPAEIIVDNRDTATTSRTGGWSLSGATDPYGPDSLWSRDGATFSWYFFVPRSDDYSLQMWWSSWPSRATNIPVDLEDDRGNRTRFFINQQINGGQWNTLNQGMLPLFAGRQYKVTIYAQPGPSSTCADAIRIR